MTLPEPSKRKPYWLWQTQRLFPSRIFAGCIGSACLLVAILFTGVAINVPGCWPMAIPSVLFFAAAFATAAAALTRPINHLTRVRTDNIQSNKPTFAIIVLLTGVYSWMLTLAMHLLGPFFKNGPGSTKYYVTLGISISSTLFMLLYGKRIVRQYFGARGGRNLEISAGQVPYIVIFIVCCGVYFAWIAV